MCLQCCAEAVPVLGTEEEPIEILPGYYLMVATKDAFAGADGKLSWPQGWYGLVIENDPEYIFPPDAVVPDPLQSHLGEDTPEEVMPWEAQAIDWATLVEQNRHYFKASPETGYRLVCAAKTAGWGEKGDLIYWLFHQMGKALQDKGL